MCTGQYLVFRLRKVLTLNFWKAYTFLPWAIFFRGNFLCWCQQRLKMLISQQEKVAWRRLIPLWNSERKEIIAWYHLFNYVLVYFIIYILVITVPLVSFNPSLKYGSKYTWYKHLFSIMYSFFLFKQFSPSKENSVNHNENDMIWA